MGKDRKKGKEELTFTPEGVFGDYQPKTSPDTVYDFIGGRNYQNQDFDTLNEFSESNLENLKSILNLFRRYKEKAKQNPGYYIDGNVILGAPPNEYMPSMEELICSEFGENIRNIIENNSKKDIEEVKKKEGIASQKIKFTEIYFTHCDVMGSGRFFYADKIEKKIVLDL